MPLDSKRFPQLIVELYRLVAELESMFPGRPFTPDGHMVGSLAECFAEYYYGLNLFRCSYPGHDAQTDTCKVEIKATQGTSVSLRSAPDKLLVFLLQRNGSFEEVYNGPGAPVWALVEAKPRPSNGQYQVRLTQCSTLPMNNQPRINADGRRSENSITVSFHLRHQFRVISWIVLFTTPGNDPRNHTNYHEEKTHSFSYPRLSALIRGLYLFSVHFNPRAAKHFCISLRKV